MLIWRMVKEAAKISTTICDPALYAFVFYSALYTFANTLISGPFLLWKAPLTWGLGPPIHPYSVHSSLSMCQTLSVSQAWFHTLFPITLMTLSLSLSLRQLTWFSDDEENSVPQATGLGSKKRLRVFIVDSGIPKQRVVLICQCAES